MAISHQSSPALFLPVENKTIDFRMEAVGVYLYRYLGCRFSEVRLERMTTVCDLLVRLPILIRVRSLQCPMYSWLGFLVIIPFVFSFGLQSVK